LKDIQDQSALKDMFEDDFIIGVALNLNQISGNEPKAMALLEKHFNSITPEDMLKWGEVHPEPNRYHFEAADGFVALGEKNKMFVVGHTLVWHHQTPAWVFRDASGHPVNRAVLLERMHDNIATIVGRYRGRIHGWDVVNEAIDDNGRMRKSKWLEIVGEDYVQKAFEYAHAADPDAALYYNDYSLDDPLKRDGVVRLIRGLQSRGVRVDGIGIQGHWGLDYPERLDDLEQSIRTFSELGVDVMITELDVSVLPFPNQQKGADISLNFEKKPEWDLYPEVLPDFMQEKLALRYSEFFQIFHKHRDKISRVTIWGIHDGQSWLNHWPIRGRTNYPLLFDRAYQAKPAFGAVVKTAHSENVNPNLGMVHNASK
jgi:endo-1,4-beta-xylanase